MRNSDVPYARVTIGRPCGLAGRANTPSGRATNGRPYKRLGVCTQSIASVVQPHCRCRPMVAPTKRYSFYDVIRFFTRFSLQEGGAKKSYQKKRQKETRKGGFLKKAPFKSRKNFWAVGAELQACAPKVRHQPESRPAGRFRRFCTNDASPCLI